MVGVWITEDGGGDTIIHRSEEIIHRITVGSLEHKSKTGALREQ